MNYQKMITSTLDMLKPNRCFVGNVFNASKSKTVLISYLTFPFMKGNKINRNHSNNSESLEIAKIFNELGYNVDIIRYNCNFDGVKFGSQKYDLVFGVEPNFLKAIKKFKPKKSIYYATGAHYRFQNGAEQERIDSLYQRTGTRLSPVRYISPHESSSLADGVLCFGNDWTKNTYKNKCKKIEMIRISAYTDWGYKLIEKEKNFETAKKNFLWFGSNGAVHKGLDLLLDIFKKNPEINLHICGNVANEKDFNEFFYRELYETKNIFFHGWINSCSVEYKDLVTQCAFTVLPSCSEGMSGTVATGMLSGLIPLISKESGIDIGSSGEIFPDCSITTITSEFQKYSEIDNSEVINRSKQAYMHAKDNFTLTTFSKDFRLGIERLLK